MTDIFPPDFSYGLNDKLSKLLAALGKHVGLFQDGIPEGTTAVEVAFETNKIPNIVFVHEDGTRTSTAVPSLDIIAIRETFSLPGPAQRMLIVFEQGEFTRYHYEFAPDFDYLDKLIEVAEAASDSADSVIMKDLINRLERAGIQWDHIPPEWVAQSKETES